MSINLLLKPIIERSQEAKSGPEIRPEAVEKCQWLCFHKYAEGRRPMGLLSGDSEYLDMHIFPSEIGSHISQASLDEIGSHISQAGLEFAKYLRVTLNF